jgi:hypothetical protein
MNHSPSQDYYTIYCDSISKILMMCYSISKILLSPDVLRSPKLLDGFIHHRDKSISKIELIPITFNNTHLSDDS